MAFAVSSGWQSMEASLPAFTAGAHIDVHLAPGLVRQYSLCSDPVDRSVYRIAVLREPQSRGGSAGMHAQVHSGSLLSISAPRNLFLFCPGAKRTLLLAGGIGITPILAMARTLHAKGEPFDRHYCGRSASRIAFVDELKMSAFTSSVQVHIDDGEPQQCFNTLQVLANPQPGTHLYVCGPSGFMDHVLFTARAAGWATSSWTGSISRPLLSIHRWTSRLPSSWPSPSCASTSQPTSLCWRSYRRVELKSHIPANPASVALA